MQFLPIVQRELLVAARKRGTYLSRTLSAGVLLAMFAALMSVNRERPIFNGAHILQVLSAIVFFECMIAGVRYTSDCLSEEKREGTLGLLFLTNLSGLDVVLGKMIARSLGAVFNLVAVIPILALTVMIGGVTGIQIATLSLAFGVSMLFSLCVGAFISSRGIRERSVLIATLALILVATFLPLILSDFALFLGNFLRNLGITAIASMLQHDLFLWLPKFSPFYLFREAGRGFAPGVSSSSWTLLTVSAGLILYASWRIHHSFGEPERPEAKPLDRGSTRTRRRSSIRFEVGPILWLASRSRTRGGMILIFGLMAVCFGIFARIAMEQKMPAGPPIIILGSYGFHLFYKFLVTAETTRQLNEDKRSGALELLLTTPILESDVVRAQIKATRKSWGPAAVCVALMNFIWMTEGTFQRDIAILLPCSLVLLFFDSYTLAWRATLNALEGRRYTATVFKTFFRVLGPPAAVLALVLVARIGTPTSQDEMAFIFFTWTAGCVVYDLVLIADALNRLKRLRVLAAGDAPVPRGRRNFRSTPGNVVSTEQVVIPG